ncbi:hypothetical protein [Allokutzneria sp. NRRL B-24872]|uniref:hypothetical protein n=1 Tax=Allokutzneria sp. NRRL B-24872 TaxID=1137961 RepID=UPI000A3B4BE2|nr:hypothetical protein [Allokutzneria sp. NRRL B-24872]
MSTITNTRKDAFLRLIMKLDAVVTGANGIAYLLGAALIGPLLGLPAGLLVPVGIFLTCYAVAVWFIGTRPEINVKAAWGVALVNLVWVVDSLVVAFSDFYPLTGWGVLWIVAQAVVVDAFAVLQVIGLRKITR